MQRHKLSRPMVSMVSKEESFLFGATVLGMGLYFWLKGGNRMPYGIPLMIFGFVAAAYSAFAYHKPQLPRIPIGIGMLFVAWIGFSYSVYYRYNSNGSREVSYPPPPQSLNNTDNSQVRWASKQIPSEKEGAKFQTELVGETDKIISNGLGVSLNCDNDLIAGTVTEGSQFGPGTDFGVDRQNRRRFYLVFHSRFPAFGPGHTLEIRLWSTHPLSCKSEIALF